MTTKRRAKIRGSGGGDDTASSGPHESGDSLFSRAQIRIIDLICEGEIEGLVDGERSIYLNETPLVDAQGNENFDHVDWDGRTGTQDQTYLEGFSSVESEVSVGVEVTQGSANAVVRQISNPEVDRVRVKLLLPQLSATDSRSGDVGGYAVEYLILLADSSGIYNQVNAGTFRGKTTSRYERQIDVPLTGDAPWSIKVQRQTADSTTSYVIDKFYFEGYTEIVDAKLRYPNSALIGVRFDAKTFQEVPSRYYDVKLSKIRIPSNYDPETREYTGSWDGTFDVAWSDNPAWVFYDLATSERYGLGAFIPEDQIDKWALYEIARYCDETVADGLGGFEPRFTCNMMIADRSEAYSVIQGLASVFRGMVHWAAGAVTLSQDGPQDAAQLYSPANVVDGKFTYQGASLKARHSVALVSWNDPEDFCRTKVEYVEDQDAIALYGIVQTEVTAVGCTSRGQAHRLGRWILYTEQNESETVTFRTGLDGILGRPGQVIKIADPVRAGARMGGRISAATTGEVTIDADPPGAVNGNTLSIMLPDGTVEDRTVISQTGRVLGVQPDFSQAGNAQAIWVLRSDDVEPQTFRIISVREEEDGTYTVTGLRHDPDKFAAIEADLILEPRSYSNLKAVPDAPQNIQINESLYQSAAEVRAKVTVSWDKVERATSYIVRARRDNDNWFIYPETTFNELDILDVQAGNYTIQVSSVNAVGKKSVPTEYTQEVYGKLKPPAVVAGFSMIPNAGQAYLTWNQATDLDVLIGGQVRIRHTPRTSDQAWSDAVDVIPAVPGTSTSALAPLLSGTYMAKFVDSSGIYSLAETLIVTTLPQTLDLNVVETIQEDPTFSGTRTSMGIDTVNGALVLADETLWDDLPLIDDVGSIDFPGDVSQDGTYDFANTYDLGGVWPAKFSATIDLEAFDMGAVFDSRTDLIDDWDDVDGDTINDVNATLYIRHTDDDPGGSPTWSDWKRIHTGEYSARAFQFQLRCSSSTDTHNLYIKQLRVLVDMADRSVNLGPLTSGTGPSYRVDYAAEFFAPPAISITANNLASGDYSEITNDDETGFDIVFKNAAGTIVSRVFYIIAKGYGRKVA